MKVKKEGFVFRVAYWFMHKDNRPDKVNICLLFWRFVLHFVILIPLAHFLATLFVSLCYAVGFQFSYKPNLKGPESWALYKKWPTIGGHRVWPISVIIVIGVFLGVARKWEICREYLIAIDNFLNRYLGHSYYVYLPLAIAFFIWLIYRGLRKTEFWQVFAAYLRAKKEKLCFIVDVV